MIENLGQRRYIYFPNGKMKMYLSLFFYYHKHFEQSVCIICYIILIFFISLNFALISTCNCKGNLIN